MNFGYVYIMTPQRGKINSVGHRPTKITNSVHQAESLKSKRLRPFRALGGCVIHSVGHRPTLNDVGLSALFPATPHTHVIGSLQLWGSNRRKMTEQIPPCGRNDCANSAGKRGKSGGAPRRRSFPSLFPKSRPSFRTQRSEVRNLIMPDNERITKHVIGDGTQWNLIKIKKI